MSTGCNCPSFVLELPMCDQKIFSPHNSNILLSSKQVLNEKKDKYQPHERRLFDLINTKLSKLTNWEMYGRKKNSYRSLVSGRVNTKLTIYHKCILTEFEDICTSGFRSREIFQLNALCKERRQGKLKGQLEKGRLPLLMSSTSLCLVPNTRCHFARKKKRNYKTSIFENLEDSCGPRIWQALVIQRLISWMCTSSHR